MIGNRTKVFRFLLLAFLLLSALSACKDLFGPLDNPVDRESENYQGYDTILDKDDIKAFFPPDQAVLASQPDIFLVSDVLGASMYQLQISISNSQFEDFIKYNNDDYTSNIMGDLAVFLPSGVRYYWRSRAYKNGSWGRWTAVSSFTIGSF